MAKNLILWLVIAVILMTLFESFTSSDSQGRMEDYTTFVREVQSDQVQEVVFDGKVINGLKRISKPGLRIYAGHDELPKVLGGLGVAIISTPKGVMTDKEARKANHGGEVLAYIW